MAEIVKLFQKADVLVLATPVYFYRYRGTPQGSVQAQILTRCSRKSQKPVTITITGFTGDERIEKDINPLITQY